MKRFCFILNMTASVLVMLVALVYILLEGTLLFLGDFLLYDMPVIAFFQRCVRLAIPLFAFLSALLSVIRRGHEMLFLSLCLLVSTAVISPFVSNHIGVGLVALSALFVISSLLCRHTDT